MRTKKQVYTEQLPATPCTPQMRGSLQEIALAQGKSMAEIQRQAVALFLRSFATDAIKNDTLLIKDATQ